MPRPSDLEVSLPAGWVERPDREELREFWAAEDGTTGILQVSELPAEDLAFIAEQSDLGALAANLGVGLSSTGVSWGTPGIFRQGDCKLGRFGASVFTGGHFPAMILWLTVSSKAALMWTWFGPNPASEEVRQAFHLVLDARHADSY